MKKVVYRLRSRGIRYEENKDLEGRDFRARSTFIDANFWLKLDAGKNPLYYARKILSACETKAGKKSGPDVYWMKFRGEGEAPIPSVDGDYLKELFEKFTSVNYSLDDAGKVSAIDADSKFPFRLLGSVMYNGRIDYSSQEVYTVVTVIMASKIRDFSGRYFPAELEEYIMKSMSGYVDSDGSTESHCGLMAVQYIVKDAELAPRGYICFEPVEMLSSVEEKDQLQSFMEAYFPGSGFKVDAVPVAGEAVEDAAAQQTGALSNGDVRKLMMPLLLMNAYSGERETPPEIVELQNAKSDA